MRTRNHDWMDTKAMRPMYGFQVFADGKWVNACDGDKPCIYVTETERDAKRAEARKIRASVT